MKKLRPAVLVLGFIFAGVATAQTPPAQKPGTATSHPAARPAGSTYDRALLNPALLKQQAPAEYDVKFITTKGDFTVHVTRDWAPIGADRFYNLVKHHYYDGVAFFRVIPGFMAQFGVSPYPVVAKAWDNAAIKDDLVKHGNTRGAITFAAESAPNTRTTQVFINFKNNAFLDSQTIRGVRGSNAGNGRGGPALRRLRRRGGAGSRKDDEGRPSVHGEGLSEIGYG